MPDSGLFMERGSERFAGMVVVPDASGGLVRWLAGRAVASDRTPRFQSLPGPKPVLGLGRLGPAPPWAVLAEGLFDWLAITGWGLPARVVAVEGEEDAGPAQKGGGDAGELAAHARGQSVFLRLLSLAARSAR